VFDATPDGEDHTIAADVVGSRGRAAFERSGRSADPLGRHTPAVGACLPVEEGAGGGDPTADVNHWEAIVSRDCPHDLARLDFRRGTRMSSSVPCSKMTYVRA
jgi:hypothetical protein